MLKKIIGLVSLMALFGINIFAQTSTATLSGSVSDENGAAIVGATVTVLNTETGVKRTVVTNENGGFTIPLLQPSKYQLTVQQNSFAPFEANELVLNTNDNRLINIRLKAGSINEKVVVEANSVQVDTSPAVSTTVDQNMVERIPLNGRTIQNLIALTPGAVTFQPNNSSNVGQISVNGLRTTQNYMTIDGVSANLYVGTNLAGVGQSNGNVPGFSQLGTTSNLVSVDALEEFKVQTSNYSAEYGRTPGAQIQLTTRSGKNTYRGSLFEYFRNEKLDANDWFANAGGLKRSPLRHNNFGGTFS
ncbi:MAG: carboxypeptidase regulatory-like domain-containing protein, partial [Acidobacteriota bacterium]